MVLIITTMKKIVVLILLLGLLTGCEIPVLLEDVNPETNSSLKGTSLIIPDDYTTIQEAVNTVEDGDIIIINEGIYPACKLPPFPGHSKSEVLSKFSDYFKRCFIIRKGGQNEKYINNVVKMD